jgi:hypothetical protein
VNILLDFKAIFFAAFPATKTDEILSQLKKRFPAAVKFKNILDTVLNNGNPVSHPTAAILNTGRIEFTKGSACTDEGPGRPSQPFYHGGHRLWSRNVGGFGGPGWCRDPSHGCRCSHRLLDPRRELLQYGSDPEELRPWAFDKKSLAKLRNFGETSDCPIQQANPN